MDTASLAPGAGWEGSGAWDQLAGVLGGGGIADGVYAGHMCASYTCSGCVFHDLNYLI